MAEKQNGEIADIQNASSEVRDVSPQADTDPIAPSEAKASIPSIPPTSVSGTPPRGGAGERVSELKSVGSGHFTVHADGIVIGWFRNRVNPSERHDLTLSIDGDPVQVITADRPNFSKIDESDGFHSFVFVVPARFRSGEPQRFSMVAGNGTPLKTRSDTITLTEKLEPSVRITEVSETAIQGRIIGLSSRLLFGLDIWSSAGKLIKNVPVEWALSQENESTFRLVSDAVDARALVNCEWFIACPGLLNPLEFWKPAETFGFSLVRTHNHYLELSRSLRSHYEQSAVIRVKALSGAASEFRDPIKIHNVDVKALLPTALRSQSISVELEFPAAGKACNLGTFESPSRDHIRNPSFSDWSGAFPTYWTFNEGVESVRPSYFNFTNAGFLAFAPSCSSVILTVQSGISIVPRIAQEISFPSTISEDEIVVLSRSTTKCSFHIRVYDHEKRLLGSTIVGVGKDWGLTQRLWRWDVQPLPGRVGSIDVEIEGLRAGGGFVEIASLNLRSISAGLVTPTPDTRTLSDNLVQNPHLLDLSSPEDRVASAVAARVGPVQGWRLYNRKSKSARWQISHEHSDGCGSPSLTFGADNVPEYFRLEVALKSSEIESDQSYFLSLRTAVPSIPHTLSIPSQYARFSNIDRIGLLRRDAEGVDKMDAVIAKRVAVTRIVQEHMFRFRLNSEQASDGANQTFIFQGDSDAPNGRKPDELFLVFEFRGPVWLKIGSLVVSRANEGSAAHKRAAGSLEDPNIAAQASALRGLQNWTSRSPSRLQERPEPSKSRPVSDMCRWNWAWSEFGAVEIVVCAYNAPDETIACLASLVGSSTVPHTVRIVDDCSEIDTRERIAAFIKGKPWMHVVLNEKNLGYTKTANIGILGSSADWVILLNSDTIVTRGWIEAMLQCAVSDPQIAFVGPLSNAASYQSIPQLRDSSGKWSTNALPNGWSVEDVALLVREKSRKEYPVVPLLNGFCTLMRRSVFVQLGGLNEVAFPVGYGEENDLCLRASKAGYKLAVADDVYVYHEKSASFGGSMRQTLAKAGDLKFRELHSDVNINELTRTFAEVPALAYMRHATSELVKI